MISPAAANTILRFSKLITLILPIVGLCSEDPGPKIQEAVQATIARTEQAKASQALRELLCSISVPIPAAELPSPLSVARDLIQGAPVTRLSTDTHKTYRFTANDSIPSALLSITVDTNNPAQVINATLRENCIRPNATVVDTGEDHLPYATNLLELENNQSLFKTALKRIELTRFT